RCRCPKNAVADPEGDRVAVAASVSQHFVQPGPDSLGRNGAAALAGGLLEAFLQGVIDGLALLGIQAARTEIQFLADGFEAQALVLGRVFQGRDEVDAPERLPSRAGHVQSVHYGARGQRFTGAGLQPEFLRDRLGDAWSIAVLEGRGEHPGGIYVWRNP